MAGVLAFLAFLAFCRRGLSMKRKGFLGNDASQKNFAFELVAPPSKRQERQKRQNATDGGTGRWQTWK